MALLGAKIARSAPTVDLSAYAIDDASMQWLEDRLGSRSPKVSAVDSLARSQLDATERRFMNALLDVMRGGGRSVTVSITKNGAGEAKRAGVMQPTLQPKTREAAVVARVRDAVEAALWGQEKHLEAFCTVARDHASETRTLPAVLVVSGNRGHGKTEALAALARGLCDTADSGGSKPLVHVVDLSTATDASAAALFEDEGLLADKSLQALVKRSIVCISGANDLQARAPRVAQRLQALLLTTRNEKDYRSLVYAFDFDQTVDSPIKAVSQALGPVGTRIASAYAQFDDLGAETMQRYCVARLPQLLKSKALGNVRVDLDEAALSLLGAALATPHMPIEELDARAYHLILAHLEVADDGGQRCPTRVQMTAAADPDEAAAIIANLTSPLPDITLAKKLLRVVQVVPEAGSEVVDMPVAIDAVAAAPVEEAESTHRSTIEGIHAYVVERAQAGDQDALFRFGSRYDKWFVRMLAGMELATHQHGVDLNAALNFISRTRPQTSVGQIEAATAIALLASIRADRPEEHSEEYNGQQVPRAVVVTLETLNRLRDATPDELDRLRGLAETIIRETPTEPVGQRRTSFPPAATYEPDLARLLAKIPRAVIEADETPATESVEITDSSLKLLLDGTTLPMTLNAGNNVFIKGTAGTLAPPTAIAALQKMVDRLSSPEAEAWHADCVNDARHISVTRYVLEKCASEAMKRVGTATAAEKKTITSLAGQLRALADELRDAKGQS